MIEHCAGHHVYDVDPCSMDGNLSGGIVILLIKEDSTRGCWVPAEECLHACLLGNKLISYEGKLDERARCSRHIAEILGGGTTGITAKSQSSL